MILLQNGMYLATSTLDHNVSPKGMTLCMILLGVDFIVKKNHILLQGTNIQRSLGFSHMME